MDMVEQVSAGSARRADAVLRALFLGFISSLCKSCGSFLAEVLHASFGFEEGNDSVDGLDAVLQSSGELFSSFLFLASSLSLQVFLADCF